MTSDHDPMDLSPQELIPRDSTLYSGRPPYYIRGPGRWPVKSLGSDEMIARIRELLPPIMDPDFAYLDPWGWLSYCVALGRLAERFPAALFQPRVTRLIGKYKAAALKCFVDQWFQVGPELADEPAEDRQLRVRSCNLRRGFRRSKIGGKSMQLYAERIYLSYEAGGSLRADPAEVIQAALEYLRFPPEGIQEICEEIIEKIQQEEE